MVKSNAEIREGSGAYKLPQISLPNPTTLGTAQLMKGLSSPTSS
jgi:hypothetical protein